jgi:drug/metabolite transporter (DMT)-like permease
MQIKPAAPWSIGGRGVATAVAIGFVLVWSTGFIVARFGVPHSPALSFLALRFALTLIVLAPLILLVRAPWPSARDLVHLSIAGVLIHALYLSGVWIAIDHGMPSAMSALIVNMQPMLTALWVAWAGEQVSRRQWLGLGMGLLGVVLAVASKWTAEGVTTLNLVCCVLALVGITAGTLYQKRQVPTFDLRTGTFVQLAASLALVGPLALMFDTRPVVWEAELLLALAWAVLAISIGAVFLLFRLIERGSATSVSSLMYLVPPSTALMAWLLFDEAYGWLAAAGMVCAALGVALVQRTKAPATPPGAG